MRGPPPVTRVRGLRVGHASDPERRSGVTVLLFDDGAPTVVEARGGAPGVFDTASLALDATFGRRWAIFFSGGSLFGLDAARGIRARILETGGGTTAFGNPFRIVPISGAVLFDLPRRLGPLPDYLPLGYEAARTASRRGVAWGRVGAGTGASVGKYLGRGRAQPGGVGSASSELPGGGRIGAVVVLNSVGAIRDPDRPGYVAGARDRRGRVVAPVPGRFGPGRTPHGTSLVAVVTDLAVERATLQRVAVSAHDGLARLVVPAHTATDGDVVFAVSTASGAPARSARPGALADALGGAASELVVRAGLRAVGAER